MNGTVLYNQEHDFTWLYYVPNYFSFFFMLLTLLGPCAIKVCTYLRRCNAQHIHVSSSTQSKMLPTSNDSREWINLCPCRDGSLFPLTTNPVVSFRIALESEQSRNIYYQASPLLFTAAAKILFEIACSLFINAFAFYVG